VTFVVIYLKNSSGQNYLNYSVMSTHGCIRKLLGHANIRASRLLDARLPCKLLALDNRVVWCVSFISGACFITRSEGLVKNHERFTSNIIRSQVVNILAAKGDLGVSYLKGTRGVS